MYRLGDTGFWVYEADLTIVWKNVDNPEDSESVTLHAVGTNEMPDKAKGSAWTYTLKYYFFQKFAINQGGEDPDMNPAVKKDENAGKGMGTENAPGQENGKGQGGNGSAWQETASVVQQEAVAPGGKSMESAAGMPVPGIGTAPAAAGILTLEDARSLVCSFGINKGRTMGQIVDDPVNGTSYLEWFAYSYRGKNDLYRQAAGLLLQEKAEEAADAA